MPSFALDRKYDKTVSVSNNRGGILKLFDDSVDIAIRDTASGEVSELKGLGEGEEKTTWFIWLLISCCAISGLLFGETNVYPAFTNQCACPGYDTGVVSGALVTIGSDLSSSTLSNTQKASQSN
jgi:MFS transporter, SP family, solute carrier family 2 (myo-inositol transporter), member 13